jgi:hypothetical protein
MAVKGKGHNVIAAEIIGGHYRSIIAYHSCYNIKITLIFYQAIKSLPVVLLSDFTSKLHHLQYTNRTV